MNGMRRRRRKMRGRNTEEEEGKRELRGGNARGSSSESCKRMRSKGEGGDGGAEGKGSSSGDGVAVMREVWRRWLQRSRVDRLASNKLSHTLVDTFTTNDSQNWDPFWSDNSVCETLLRVAGLHDDVNARR